MKLLKLIIFFLFINLGALAIGSWLMNNGPRSQWYFELTKAPWTPPSWVFGAAWTTIMICFSIFMALLIIKQNSLHIKLVFAVQLLLNISWNLFFFNLQSPLLGLINIIGLTVIVWYFFIAFYKLLAHQSFLVLPYAVWLCLATSLNLYIVLYNCV